MGYKILWVDDEIELLRSHIIFLNEKGYLVETVTNGEDALSEVKEKNYDLIFLDEMMPGLGGLETLALLKEINPDIPVVMVTKSEEESLMNEAIGGKISDYLIKPVVPSQMLLVCKKFLEGKKISSEHVAKDYLTDFNQISSMRLNDLDFNGWTDLYIKLTNWEIELSEHPELGFTQTLADQKKECNQEFSKYIEKRYKGWINNPGAEKTPLFSPQIAGKYLLPHVQKSENPVFFVVIDCLRLDQWLIMEKHLKEFFDIEKDYYCSILPTATAYARNALFAGLYPSDIQKYFPDLWLTGEDDEERAAGRLRWPSAGLLSSRSGPRCSSQAPGT